MKLLWVIIGVVIVASGIAQAAYMNDTAFDQGNGIYLTFMNTTFDNLTCCSSNTFFMNVSSHAITFTAGANKTVTNPTWGNDNFTFQVFGISGYINFSSTMINTSDRYDLIANGVFVESSISDINGIVWFNYTGDNVLSVIWNVSTFNQNVYNTGWQTIFINSTQNMTSIRSMMNLSNVLWITRWNATSQKWESYKAGWSYRATNNTGAGEAVYLKVANNDTVTRKNGTGSSSYNYTAKLNWNLWGNEMNQSQTLSQINTSINSLGTCDVNKIVYLNPETQTEYTYTCGLTNNESISVNTGFGYWANSTIEFDRIRG